MLLPPLIPPAPLRSSRSRAPRRSPPAPPPSLPSPAGNAPTGWRGGSALRNSHSARHRPPLPPPVSSSPALQTARAHTSPVDTPPPSHSTRTAPAPAPTPAAPAVALPPAPPPPSPSLPATGGSIPGSAPSSSARTAMWHIPVFLRSDRPLPVMTMSDQTLPAPGMPASGVSPRLLAVQTRSGERSARQASPGTAGCMPGCAPARLLPPPAQTEYPDSAAPAAPALSSALTVPLRWGNLTDPH